MRKQQIILVLLAAFLIGGGNATDEKPGPKSGPQIGERIPGAFLATDVINMEIPSRVGQKNSPLEQHENAAVVALVFAREIHASLFSLAKRLDDHVAKNKAANVKAILVMLSDEKDIAEGLKKLAALEGISHTHVMVMPSVGPPKFNITKDADVTVILYRRIFVTGNRSFKKGALNDGAIGLVLSDLDKTTPAAETKRPDGLARLDAELIGIAAGAKATTAPDGVVRIGWPRTDVAVQVDGMPLKPFAGLGSWAAFSPTPHGAMMMGDTVVFQDEVDAAMDAAFAHRLEVTALHNHFFYDEPKVYFMHIGGQGNPLSLASSVKAVWDAIKKVRADRPQPATGFGGEAPRAGKISADAIESILGHKSETQSGVVKITIGREGSMHGVKVAGSMGLTTWAAFSGSDALAAVDGDFIMTAAEVQPVLKALRKKGIHVVALHNHMAGEQPAFYFAHFWGKGGAEELARSVKSALDAQAKVANLGNKH